jgi:pimeloyl-ACP methyl ester carboxylesterase
MAHPLQLRASVLGGQLGLTRRTAYPLAFQVPMFPERHLVRDGAAQVGEMLAAWSGPGWPDRETQRVYQRAMRIPPVSHTSLEYLRWFFRSSFRPDGMRYAHQMRSPVQVPTLHLHGAADPCVPAVLARGAGRYVDAPYRWRVLEGLGHYPHEERPEAFDSELLGWLADAEPDR